MKQTCSPKAWDCDGPWVVGSGSQEQNGTFDMMGNIVEWTETTFSGDSRIMRGSHYSGQWCSSSYRDGDPMFTGMNRETRQFGFRVCCVPYEEPKTEGLLGLWLLDEQDGATAADASGHSWDGTLVGDPVWRPGEGVFDGALEFDGIDDYLEIRDCNGVTGSRSRTCALWVKVPPAAPAATLMSWGQASPGGKWIPMIHADGSLRVAVWGGYINGTRDLRDDQWHHMTMVLEEGDTDVKDIKLYVDGRPEQPGSFSSQTIYTGIGDNVILGCYSESGIPQGYYFQGRMDEVLIFDVALIGREIERLYLDGAAAFMQPCGDVRLDPDIRENLGIDITKDCKIDLRDVVLVFSQWLETGLQLGDVNRDEIVNLGDYSKIAGSWMSTIDPYLVAYWPLDEPPGTATAYDSAGNKDGRLCNNPLRLLDQGVLGGVMQFDGVDDYVEMTGYKGLTGSRQRTCAFWIKAPVESTGGTLLSWGKSEAGKKWIVMLGSNGVLRVGLWGGYADGTRDLRDDQWHHVAIVLGEGIENISEVKIYIDGQLDPRGGFNPQVVKTVAEDDMTLGCFHENTGSYWDYFQGSLDEVRIYSRALSLAEIEALSDVQ